MGLHNTQITHTWLNISMKDIGIKYNYTVNMKQRKGYLSITINVIICHLWCCLLVLVSRLRLLLSVLLHTQLHVIKRVGIVAEVLFRLI